MASKGSWRKVLFPSTLAGGRQYTMKHCVLVCTFEMAPPAENAAAYWYPLLNDMNDQCWNSGRIQHIGRTKSDGLYCFMCWFLAGGQDASCAAD